MKRLKLKSFLCRFNQDCTCCNRLATYLSSYPKCTLGPILRPNLYVWCPYSNYSQSLSSFQSYTARWLSPQTWRPDCGHLVVTVSLHGDGVCDVPVRTCVPSVSHYQIRTKVWPTFLFGWIRPVRDDNEYSLALIQQINKGIKNKGEIYFLHILYCIYIAIVLMHYQLSRRKGWHALSAVNYIWQLCYAPIIYSFLHWHLRWGRCQSRKKSVSFWIPLI